MNLFKNLMFLQGHFTRDEDFEESRTEYGARTTASDFAPTLGNRAASARWFTRLGRRYGELSANAAIHTREAEPVQANQALSVLDQLLLLGGRPMHAGHNFDLDDPFELPTDTVSRVDLASIRKETPQAQTKASLQPQCCNG